MEGEKLTPFVVSIQGLKLHKYFSKECATRFFGGVCGRHSPCHNDGSHSSYANTPPPHFFYVFARGACGRD
jgi:hypothetical protein